MPIPHPGELAALATALCWTVCVLAFEAADKRIGSLAVNLLRLLMGLALLSLYTGWARGLPLPVDATSHAWFWLGLSH